MVGLATAFLSLFSGALAALWVLGELLLLAKKGDTVTQPGSALGDLGPGAGAGLVLLAIPFAVAALVAGM